MKKILLFYFSLLPFLASGQWKGQAHIDSLLTVLSSGKFKDREDSVKIALLNDISFEYATTSPDKGLTYGFLALALAEKLGLSNWTGITSMAVASSYFVKANYPKALEYDLKALKIFESNNDLQQKCKVYSNIGNLYRRTKQRAKSLKYFEDALKIAEELRDKNAIGKNLSAIASTYQEERNAEKALEFSQKALPVLREAGDKFSEISCLLTMANIYSDVTDFVKAKELYLRVLEENKKLDNPQIWASGYGSLGELLLSISRNPAFKGSEAEKKAGFKEGISYLTKAIKYSKKIDDAEATIEFTKYRSWGHSLLGEYKDAFEDLIEYYAVKDSLFSNDNKLKISGLETQREADLKLNQIEINKLQARESRNERVFYIVGIGLLAGLIIVVLRNYYKKQRINTRLETAIKQLQDEKSKSDALAQSLKESLVQKDELAAQLEHSAAMKSKFLANISLELRTPVTLLTGMLELIRDNQKTDDKRIAQNTEIAYANSRKLQYMVEEILDLSKLEIGESKLHSKTREIGPLLRRIVFAFETLIQKEGLTLDYNDKSATLSASIDESRFEKIINNLVHNAIKFNKRDGWIRVTVYPSPDGKSIVIEIGNAGAGIAAKDLPHVFERYYQGDTSKARADGAGIGLSLVNEFTTLMDGMATVTSSAEHGTIFTLRFPVAVKNAVEEIMPAEPELPEIAWSHFAHKPTVLLVEDNAEMRYYLKEILGGKVNLAEAGNGKEALKWLEKNTPNLIISDIMDFIQPATRRTRRYTCRQ